MKKVPWNGATKWLTPTKPMILLCLRGKGEDKFWFSFFHEAGHVLHDSKKDLLINDGSQGDPREERANRVRLGPADPRPVQSRPFASCDPRPKSSAWPMSWESPPASSPAVTSSSPASGIFSRTSFAR